MPSRGCKAVFAGLPAIFMLNERHNKRGLDVAARWVAVSVGIPGYSPGGGGKGRLPGRLVILIILSSSMFAFADNFITGSP